jgi:hypothetical protein
MGTMQMLVVGHDNPSVSYPTFFLMPVTRPRLKAFVHFHDALCFADAVLVAGCFTTAAVADGC